MMLSESGFWSSRQIRRPGRPSVEWLPFGSLGEPEVIIGVLQDGSWVVDTADGLVSLDDEQALTFAFSVLNSCIQETRQKLSDFKASSQCKCCKEFPLSRLVVHAIQRGGYWAEQSLPWLAELELNNDEKTAVIRGMLDIENNKDFSQELRHKMKRHRQKLGKA